MDSNVPRNVSSTVRINRSRRWKRRKRRAGGYRLSRGVPGRPPAQWPPAETTDGTEARCSTGARPSVNWVTRLIHTSIRGSEVGRALGRSHDLSRRQWLANSHSDSVCQKSLQSLCAASFSWGALCLPYVVAEADRGPHLRRRVGGPASARLAVFQRAPPPVGALCTSKPRTVDLEPRLLDRYDPGGRRSHRGRIVPPPVQSLLKNICPPLSVANAHGCRDRSHTNRACCCRTTKEPLSEKKTNTQW